MQVLAYGVEGMPLRKVLQELDVRKAQATVESDRERILQAIEADLGWVGTGGHKGVEGGGGIGGV